MRADSGRQHGAGHVMRCLAVAEQARDLGWRVTLSAALSELPWVERWLVSLQVRLVEPCDEPSGLAGLAEGPGAVAVLLDHHDFPPAMAEVAAAGAVLVSFEDGVFGRRPAHIVVDLCCDGNLAQGCRRHCVPPTLSSLLLG